MPTVLAVDDEPTVLRVLAKELGERPYEFITATSGEQALAILSEREVDVVVTDQHMAGVTGYEVLEAARERNPDTVGILMIYQRERDVGRQATTCGLAQRCIVKPWEFKEIPYVVACAVETYRLRIENQRLRCVAPVDEPRTESSSVTVAETFGAILQARFALEVLARDLQGDLPGPAEMENMRRTVHAIQQMIGRLPDHVGDATRGGGPSCPLSARADLARVLARIRRNLGGIAASRKVSLIVDSDCGVRLLVDADRTDPPLLLLGSLAIGNVRAGGAVEIRAEHDPDRHAVRIDVIDDGPPPERRAAESVSESPLRTVKRMLADAGGDLVVGRTADARNRFALRIPVAVQPLLRLRSFDDRYTEAMPDAFPVVIA